MADRDLIYVNIVYSHNITSRKAKKKSKALFQKLKLIYKYKNGTFTHPEKDFTLHLEARNVHIAIPNDFSSQALINAYLQDVFGQTFINVDAPKNKAEIILKSLNYALV